MSGYTLNVFLCKTQWWFKQSKIFAERTVFYCKKRKSCFNLNSPLRDPFLCTTTQRAIIFRRQHPIWHKIDIAHSLKSNTLKTSNTNHSIMSTMNGGSGGNNPHKFSDQFVINFLNIEYHHEILIKMQFLLVKRM